MAKLEATADWQGGMEYAIHAGDHVITTDAPEVYGGKNHGPKPTHMLLAGLMGCTGMDVASLLRKMRVPVAKISLDSSADVADTDPHVFKSIELNYRFEGGAELADHVPQIQKAIHMSKEKLCCVSIMFRHFCQIHTHAYVNGTEIEL
ncbi:MAG TPA: OsmC family protein [Holophaga sp.]|mgnify:CR=1 FL=1|nr:OsmC family protein [Holophaga sp.]HPS66728.1 OsmC family protein [Holophaga sp.]